MQRSCRSISGLLCLLIGLVLCALSAVAADEDYSSPKIGFAAAVQGSQFDILVPIWTNERVVVVPAVGVTSVSDAVTDWRFGILARYNLRVGRAVPYCGVRVAMLTMVPDVGDHVTDIVYGGALGGEYFFERHFSLGVEVQLNVAQSSDHSSRFANPGGTNINTATAVMASFYF